MLGEGEEGDSALASDPGLCTAPARQPPILRCGEKGELKGKVIRPEAWIKETLPAKSELTLLCWGRGRRERKQPGVSALAPGPDLCSALSPLVAAVVGLQHADLPPCPSPTSQACGVIGYVGAAVVPDGLSGTEPDYCGTDLVHCPPPPCLASPTLQAYGLVDDAEQQWWD